MLDPEAEVIPPGEGTEQVVQEAKPDTENVEVKLSADIFPNKEQVSFIILIFSRIQCFKC